MKAKTTRLLEKADEGAPRLEVPFMGGAVIAGFPPPEIEKNLEDDFTILFRNHPEYAVALGNALRDALKAGKDEFDQSARLMETLQAAPISEMLLRCRGQTLSKHGITFMENEEDSGRLEMFLDLWGERRLRAGA